MTVVEYAAETLAEANAAAYRALAAFRLNAAERRRVAAHAVAMLADVPSGFLPGVIEAGAAGGIASEILNQAVPYTLSASKRRDAAGAAVVAAAGVLAQAESKA